jgi:4-amino-4-deoxy-L-arabinose transferase-like glycosyltransferase
MSRRSTPLDGRGLHRYWPVILLSGLGLPVFLLGLGSPGLFDPHESLYAEVAREMVMSGDWLTPHLNGTRYLDKPPLFYWLIALSYVMFGVSEFAARLPTALAGFASTLVTYGIGRQLLVGNAAFLAGLILTASIGTFVFSRQVLPDMVFACFTTLTIAGLTRVMARDGPRGWAIASSVGLALAVMTKGVLGFFPLFLVAAYALWLGRWQALRALITPAGMVIFVVMTVPWHVYIAWQNEGYAWHYFANEQFLRFLGQRYPLDFISLPLPIFLLILFFWLLPWSPYLALGLPRHWPKLGQWRGPERGDSRLPLLWAALLLLFFSLSHARLPQYSLPAMPALALLIGTSLEERWSGRVVGRLGLLIATAVSLTLAALASVLLPSYLGAYHQIGLNAEATALIRLVFWCMAGGSGTALLALLGRHWGGGLLCLTAGMAGAFFSTHQVLVQLEPYRSSRGIAALIEAQGTGGARLVLEVEKDDPFEYEQIAGLAFYTRLPVDLLRRKNRPILSLPLKPTERSPLSTVAFQQLWSSEKPVYLVTDSFLDGEGVLDRQSTFVVVGQVGNRWVLTNHH